jgi:hypothetical protein
MAAHRMEQDQANLMIPRGSQSCAAMGSDFAVSGMSNRERINNHIRELESLGYHVSQGPSVVKAPGVVVPDLVSWEEEMKQSHQESDERTRLAVGDYHAEQME